MLYLTFYLTKIPRYTGRFEIQSASLYSLHCGYTGDRKKTGGVGCTDILPVTDECVHACACYITCMCILPQTCCCMVFSLKSWTFHVAAGIKQKMHNEHNALTCFKRMSRIKCCKIFEYFPEVVEIGVVDSPGWRPERSVRSTTVSRLFCVSYVQIAPFRSRAVCVSGRRGLRTFMIDVA